MTNKTNTQPTASDLEVAEGIDKTKLWCLAVVCGRSHKKFEQNQGDPYDDCGMEEARKKLEEFVLKALSERTQQVGREMIGVVKEGEQNLKALMFQEHWTMKYRFKLKELFSLIYQGMSDRLNKLTEK